MLISRSREKLINAILYFAENTRALGKIKLFKLLYLLDFEHFRKTGRPVTGMEYRAWKMGPVPAQLVQEWDQLEQDMADAIEIRPERVIDYVRENVVAKRAFDQTHFTPREIEIMGGLARKYADVMSGHMIDVTHAENGAWAKVWQDGLGSDQQIDYRLAIPDDDPHRDDLLDADRDRQALNRATVFRGEILSRTV